MLTTGYDGVKAAFTFLPFVWTLVWLEHRQPCYPFSSLQLYILLEENLGERIRFNLLYIGLSHIKEPLSDTSL